MTRAALALVLAFAPGMAVAAATVEQPLARLGALDKTTARVSELKGAVGSTLTFGSLSITINACRRSPPEDTPESAAFLKVADHKPGQPEETIFTGWMMASSPAVSAMEHPVYDIWVIDCAGLSDQSPAVAPGASVPIPIEQPDPDAPAPDD